VNKNLNIVHPR